MSTSANSMQVGGTHYKSEGTQHWDWVSINGLSYLAGNATKYVSRWRKKNGIQDLQKAVHYVTKMKEQVEAGHLLPFDGDVEISAMRFCQDNDIVGFDAEIISLIAWFTNVDDLDRALTLLNRLMTDKADS